MCLISVPHWIKLSVSIFHLSTSSWPNGRITVSRLTVDLLCVLSIFVDFLPCPSLKCLSFRAHLFCPWLINLSTLFTLLAHFFFLWSHVLHYRSHMEVVHNVKIHLFKLYLFISACMSLPIRHVICPSSSTATLLLAR